MNNIITILNDGKPYCVCCPVDKVDLENFLAGSANCVTGEGFSTRAPSKEETAKWNIEYQLHIKNGGSHDSFFGVSL